MSENYPTPPFKNNQLSFGFLAVAARKAMKRHPVLSRLAPTECTDFAVTLFAELSRSLHLEHKMVELNMMCALATVECGAHERYEPTRHALAVATVEDYLSKYDKAPDKTVPDETVSKGGMTFDDDLLAFLDKALGLSPLNKMQDTSRKYVLSDEVGNDIIYNSAEELFAATDGTPRQLSEEQKAQVRGLRINEGLAVTAREQNIPEEDIIAAVARDNLYDVPFWAARNPYLDNIVLLGTTPRELIERIESYIGETLSEATKKHVANIPAHPPVPRPETDKVEYPADLGAKDEVIPAVTENRAFAEGSAIPPLVKVSGDEMAGLSGVEVKNKSHPIFSEELLNELSTVIPGEVTAPPPFTPIDENYKNPDVNDVMPRRENYGATKE